MTAPTAEEWRQSVTDRVARLAQAQADQRRRAVADGRCEVCGAPDSPTVMDFTGVDGVRRLCGSDARAAGLGLTQARSPSPD